MLNELMMELVRVYLSIEAARVVARRLRLSISRNGLENALGAP
jgi:hypothetical protein